MASENSSARPVDMELKKAFQELQTRMISTTQQLKVSDMQIEQLKRQIAHSRLVEKEIESLPKDTKTYEGVGRMFVLQPIETVEKKSRRQSKSLRRESEIS